MLDNLVGAKYDAIVGFPGTLIIAVRIVQKLEYRRAGNDAAGEGQPLRPQLVGEGEHQIAARGFANQNDILRREGFQQMLITGLAITERINALVSGTETIIHRKNIVSPMLHDIGNESKGFLCGAFPESTAMDIIQNFIRRIPFGADHPGTTVWQRHPLQLQPLDILFARGKAVVVFGLRGLLGALLQHLIR